jgi:hypothetical protein
MAKEDYEIDEKWVYGENTTLDDLSDEDISWLEENDPDRLDEISSNTEDMYMDMMFPDGQDDD